jgi:hypothetical protein
MFSEGPEYHIPSRDPVAEKADYLKNYCSTDTSTDVHGLLEVTASLIAAPFEDGNSPLYSVTVTYGYVGQPDAASFTAELDTYEGEDQTYQLEGGTLDRTSDGYSWGNRTHHVSLGSYPGWGEVACDLAYGFLAEGPYGDAISSP